MRRATPTSRRFSACNGHPGGNRCELPAPLKRELLDLVRALRKPGDHPLKNAGEVSTVLMAQHLGGDLVVLEDHDGKSRSRRRASVLAQREDPAREAQVDQRAAART